MKYRLPTKYEQCPYLAPHISRTTTRKPRISQPTRYVPPCSCGHMGIFNNSVEKFRTQRVPFFVVRRWNFMLFPWTRNIDRSKQSSVSSQPAVRSFDASIYSTSILGFSLFRCSRVWFRTCNDSRTKWHVSRPLHNSRIIYLLLICVFFTLGRLLCKFFWGSEMDPFCPFVTPFLNFPVRV